MKQLIMLKGLPASGKSTWAKATCTDNPGAYKVVNKDSLRAMLDGGKWSSSNEAFVLSVRNAIIKMAFSQGKHAIVDDTNLAPKHEATLRNLAPACGAQFVVQDFTGVSLEECISRDRMRPNYVGERVILDMWHRLKRVRKYGEVKDIRPPLVFTK